MPTLLMNEMLAHLARFEIVDPSVRRASELLLRRSRTRPSAQLTGTERDNLRQARIRRAELGHIDPVELASRSGFSVLRAREVVSLTDFQKMRSIGQASAEDLFQLGFDQRRDLVGAHPRAMHFAYSALVGGLVDRCVEDVFRCAVAQAELPNLSMTQKNWWWWTGHRGDQRLPNI